MSTAGGGPNIVTSGLVLSLDAANPKSFINGSLTWNDLTKNNYAGTLINGPTYSSLNAGTIAFDGVDDYITLTNNNILQIFSGTISVWFKTSNPGSGYRSIIAKQWNYGLFTDNNVLITYDWSASAVRSTGINIADNTWKQITMTFTDNSGNPSNNANIFLNGVNVLTTTIKVNTSFLVELEIGRGGTVPTGNSQYINGQIPIVNIYNKVLTSSEVLQNYNATKSRFGL